MTNDGEGYEFEGTEEEYDDLVAKVCMADQRDDISTRETCEELLAWCSLEGKVPDKKEAIELIAQKTDFNKSTAKEWYNEVSAAASLQYLDVHRIVQIIPYDPDEPHTFEFHVEADGERATFRIDSSDLMSQTTFQSKIMELCHHKVTFDDWDEQINEWMDQATIEERKAEPISPEHELARRTIESISTSEATLDEDEFKADATKLLMKPDEREVWVRSELLGSVMSSQSGEVSRRRLRAILDDVLAGNKRKIRDSDGHVNAWRFDMDALDDTDAVDIETLLNDAEAEDT